MNAVTRVPIVLLLAAWFGGLPTCAPSRSRTTDPSRDESRPRAPRFEHAPGSPVAVGPKTERIVVSDMNGDGNSDLVLTIGSRTEDKRDPVRGGIAVLLGDGRGAFRAAQPPIPMGMGGLKVAVGDFDGDRRNDIVVIAHDSYLATILLQDSRGRFDGDARRTVPAKSGNHPHTHGVAVADMNGDHKADILTSLEDDGCITVLLGDGSGGFQPAPGSPFAAGLAPYEGLGIADLNGDDKLDAVVPNLRGNAVSVLLGNGTGALAPAPGSPIAVGPRPGFVALGDLDGDAKCDLVVTHDDDPILVILRGDGRGGFRATRASPTTLEENVWGAAIGDMNADGKNDVVLGAKKDHVLLLLGDGKGGLAADAIAVPVGGTAPWNVALADLDGDGKLDLLTSNHETGNVSVLLQR
jgi:VCBS repeat protein